MAQAKPQVIDDEEHERVYERVAAGDVAKDSGMVCTRTPHRCRPGARQSTVWTVKARMGPSASSMRSRWARVSSSELISRAARRRASSWAGLVQRGFMSGAAR